MKTLAVLRANAKFNQGIFTRTCFYSCFFMWSMFNMRKLTHIPGNVVLITHDSNRLFNVLEFGCKKSLENMFIAMWITLVFLLHKLLWRAHIFRKLIHTIAAFRHDCWTPLMMIYVNSTFDKNKWVNKIKVFMIKLRFDLKRPAKIKLPVATIIVHRIYCRSTRDDGISKAI